MIKKIPYARQDISEDDILAVSQVLGSDYLTQGPVVPAFENFVKSYCNAGEAVALNSATSALHVACLAMGIGSGDIVWTTPNSFVASANCALYCGATIDFVDIDPATYNISLIALEEKLLAALKANSLPKLLIAVHFSGQPCDMHSIFILSQKYGFKIIEDASHAIGAMYKKIPIGSCTYSDITIFSFHPVKIITAGEGGMILTNSIDLANKCRILRSHGIVSNDDSSNVESNKEIWNYKQIMLGFNYRMTDVLAALGLSQARRLEGFVAKRRLLANKYDENLLQLPLVTPFQLEDCLSSFHLYVVRLKINEIKISQSEIYAELHSLGISVNLHYIPIYLHPYYQELGFKRGYCPEAERYFSEALSLPLFPALADADQDYVISTLGDVLR